MNRQLAGFRQFDTEQDRHGLLLESAPDADQGQIDNTAGHPRAGPGQSGEQQRVVGQCLDRQALWIDYLEDHLPRIDDLTHDGVGGADDTVNRRHQRFTAEAAAERAFSLLEGGEFDLRLLDILLRNAAFELPHPWPLDFDVRVAHLETWCQPDIGGLRGGPVVMAFVGDDRRRQGKQRQQTGRHTSSGRGREEKWSGHGVIPRA